MRLAEMMEEEVEEEFGRYAPTRFCRTDAIDVTTAGTYFPNYQVAHDNNNKPIGFGPARPTDARKRDDTFAGTVAALKPPILSKSGAVGILYVVKDQPGRIGNSDYTAGTWSLYCVNSKFIGITALHTSHNGDDDKTASKFFIDIGAYRYKDKLADIADLELAQLIADPEFIEVKIHEGSLKARKAYLTSLSAADKKYEENLDPRCHLRPEPSLDVMMFEAPAKIHSWPFFTLAAAPPVSGSLALLLAFHSSVGGRQGSDREYKASIGRPPNPGDVVWKHCSLGIGKVIDVGPGIINVINSTAYLSSGGALFNDKMEVYAMNVGGFYDDPVPKKPAKVKPALAPWQKENEPSLFRFDIGLPEKDPDSLASRNFTVALSIFHSGFQQMLNVIAK